MGDKIKIEKIVLLYGHLYQIDYYNETKDYHGRLFVEKAQVESAEEEAHDVVLDKNVMIDIGGENFRCPTCASNVFTKIKKWNGDIVYLCHGCETEYQGE